eukprot:2503884-Rhodomonas_salina.1
MHITICIVPYVYHHTHSTIRSLCTGSPSRLQTRASGLASHTPRVLPAHSSTASQYRIVHSGTAYALSTGHRIPDASASYVITGHRIGNQHRTLSQYLTSHSTRVGSKQHTLWQYRTSHSTLAAYAVAVPYIA